MVQRAGTVVNRLGLAVMVWEGRAYQSGCDAELPGPALVEIEQFDGGVFCIDATEVTNRQYQEWLSTNPSLANQPAYCGDNGTFEPLKLWPPAEDVLEHPVVWIDWCDAATYCAAGGKKLCGSAIQDFAAGRWGYGCTHGGTQSYPYGEYESGRCNTSGGDLGTRVPVATVDCEGGFPGVYDMVGDVFEWTNNCEPGEAFCRVRVAGWCGGEPIAQSILGLRAIS